MSGQLWSVPEEGGYLYSDELSSVLRMQVQPLTKFRQFADAQDGTEKGLHTGEKFHWNVYTNVAKQGTKLDELQPMPETNFKIDQRELTVTEFGNSVPYTGKLSALGKQDVVQIIDKSLKHDARKSFDAETFLQFDETPLRVSPDGGTSTDTVVLTTDGQAATTNDVGLGKDHIKPISDAMKERNIPPFIDDNYCSISHPTTYRPFKNELETIHQYVETGAQMIYRGEIGKYEDIRFVEQNHIPKGGADDSTTFDPINNVADPWDNGKSSWAYFFGGDTVVEAIVIPEEIRAKIPGDFGRSKGIAWYYLGGFGIVHPDALNARIVKWDSAE